MRTSLEQNTDVQPHEDDRRVQPAAVRPRAQLQMLHRLAARLNQAPDVPGIGEAVTSELRTLLDYHNCRVHLLHEDGETLIPIAFHGELSEYQGETHDALVIKVGQGLTGHVAKSRASYYSPDANQDPYATTIPGTKDLDESILAAPLVFDDHLIGVVVISKLGIDQFDEEDRRVLETVASHAAVAIENARRKAEIERALEIEREASAGLRALDEMKNTFLRAVSHDLRTPLTVVLGCALTLEREDTEFSPAERRDLNRLVATNAKKLNQLLVDLLDVDRLARGVVEIERQSTDVGALVEGVVSEAGLEPDRAVDVDAPSLVVEVDGPKVERILENLLLNAKKHTPPGSRIWVRSARSADGLLLVVEDDGPGITEGIGEAVFEPFRRGDPDDPSPGSGIGLSLVAQFARLHGGRAWMEERPGGGASFRVLLAC
ncbi:MAG: ATP-binding protein [Actinomycetota bacterium]